MNQSFLEDNYVNWLKSQKILKSVIEKYQNQEVSSNQLKALLENAVMYLLLYEKYKGDDFLDQIDDRHIEEGIRCVELEDELNDSVSDIKSIVRSSQVVDQEVENLQPEETDLYYKVGDFKLTKNQYTQKAFDYVALNHNESTALLVF